MNVKKLLVLSCLLFVLASVFQPSSVSGFENQTSNANEKIDLEKIDLESIELEIEEDGSYKLTSSFYMDEVKDVFLIAENIDMSIEIEGSENEISSNATIGIRFTEYGLQRVNQKLKEELPENPTDMIPFGSLIFPENYLELIDNNPIYLLDLVERSKEFAVGVINNEFMKDYEGRSLRNLAGEFNLEKILSIKGFETYLPESKIEEPKLTDYEWEGSGGQDWLSPPNLSLGFSVILSENDGSMEEYMKILPVKIDLSYLVLQEGGASLDLKVDSDAKLPGYKEKGAWKIEVPSGLENILKETNGWEQEENVIFRLKVPEGTSLEQLPEGYERIDNTTYEWTGKEGDKALKSVVEGDSLEIITGEKQLQDYPLFWIGSLVAGVMLIAIAVIAGKKEDIL